MEAETSIKIAIVDDHTILREGLAKQLAIDKEIAVIIQAEHGLDLLQQLQRAHILPDVAVIDLNMPTMDGFTLSEELRKKYPQIRLLVLSAYSSEYNVAIMINNGVCGYLSKKCTPSELKKAIHSIYETGHYYSELANEHVFKVLLNTTPKSISIPDREMEFLKLCCTELRYDQIAKEMGITMPTLNGGRERLFNRLGINSRIALVLFAVRSGIIEESPESNHLKIKL